MKTLLIVFTALFFVTGSMEAQEVKPAAPAASLSREALKKQEAVQRMTDNTGKLKMMEAQRQEKQAALDQLSKKAKSSANDYGAASGKLEDNASSKKHSKKAHKAASQAKEAAKAEKKAKQELSKMDKDINKLKKKIKKDQKIAGGKEKAKKS